MSVRNGLFSVRHRSWVDVFRHEKTAEYIDILRLVLILSCVGRRVSGAHSGAGGDWTLVQTWNQWAFYMLSPWIGFRDKTGPRQPILPLVPKSRNRVGTTQLLFPNFSAPPCPNVSERGNGEMSRSPHFEVNKGTLLYFRLRSESVIVIFANYSSTLLRL